MKKNKKAVAMAGILMVVTLLLSACGQPSREELLANPWYAEGKSEPSFTLYKDGSCTFSSVKHAGRWELIQDGEAILFIYPDGRGRDQETIISLDKKQLVLWDPFDDVGDERVLWNTPHSGTDIIWDKSFPYLQRN